MRKMTILCKVIKNYFKNQRYIWDMFHGHHKLVQGYQGLILEEHYNVDMRLNRH